MVLFGAYTHRSAVRGSCTLLDTPESDPEVRLFMCRIAVPPSLWPTVLPQSHTPPNRLKPELAAPTQPLPSHQLLLFSPGLRADSEQTPNFDSELRLTPMFFRAVSRCLDTFGTTG